MGPGRVEICVCMYMCGWVYVSVFICVFEHVCVRHRNKPINVYMLHTCSSHFSHSRREISTPQPLHTNTNTHTHTHTHTHTQIHFKPPLPWTWLRTVQFPLVTHRGHLSRIRLTRLSVNQTTVTSYCHILICSLFSEMAYAYLHHTDPSDTSEAGLFQMNPNKVSFQRKSTEEYGCIMCYCLNSILYIDIKDIHKHTLSIIAILYNVDLHIHRSTPTSIHFHTHILHFHACTHRHVHIAAHTHTGTMTEHNTWLKTQYDRTHTHTLHHFTSQGA